MDPYTAVSARWNRTMAPGQARGHPSAGGLGGGLRDVRGRKCWRRKAALPTKESGVFLKNSPRGREKSRRREEKYGDGELRGAIGSGTMHYYRYKAAEVSCFYKYLMFSYNVVFWLAGVAFIGIGIWAWSEKGVLLDLTQVTRMHGFDPVWLVLLVGGITFILGFAGCVGALRENICLLKFFSSLIGFIFFLELTAAVLAFVFQDTLRDWIKDLFLTNIKAYRDDIDLQNLIDSLQKLNHCCGASGPDDWNENLYFSCAEDNPSRERCGVPFSCCVYDPANPVVNTQCGYGIRVSNSQVDRSGFINVKGCVAAMEAWLPRNIYIVAGVFIGISLLQMVGIYLSRTLIGDIERVKFNM